VQALGLVAVLVPAVVDELLDLLGSRRSTSRISFRLPLRIAPRGISRLVVAVVVGDVRELAVGQHGSGSRAAADSAPVLVERGDRQQVGDVDLVDELDGAVDDATTMFSRSMLIAPTAPVPSTLMAQGTPPTSQFGCGFLPPKMVWILTISFWKSSASR
jgi:hypothetical protein